jgi:Na+/H+-dicarboxylate symporter
MNVNWSDLLPLAAVAVSWVAIWYLRRRNLNFSVLAVFALAIGVPIGLLAGTNVDAINPIGQIYINVLLATVAPLILVAIVSSIVSLGSLAKLRSIGLRSVGWLMGSTALAVLLALGLGLTFQPGQGVHHQLGTLSTDTVQGQVQTFSQVVVGFFPTNVVENFGANDIIPIILIAVTVSVAYLAVSEKEGPKVRIFATATEALKLVVFKAVGYVIRLTPYAIVALTAAMVGSSTNLGSDFTSLVGLLVLVWVACLIHAYVFNGAILSVFANVPVLAFFRKIFPAQLTAFSTQSSVGTLPVTTAQLTRQVGVHPEVAHFTAPLGTTIGMPGCAGIWPMLVAIWGINAYGISYSLSDYVVLAFLGVIVSVGTAGVPGAATVAAATVLSAAHLPLEFVAATIPIGVIADMARTATNVTAAAVSSTVVARQTGLLDDEIFAGRAEFVEADVMEESELVTEIHRPALPVPANNGAVYDAPPVHNGAYVPHGGGPPPYNGAPPAYGVPANGQYGLRPVATPPPAHHTPDPTPNRGFPVPPAPPNHSGMPRIFWEGRELVATGAASGPIAVPTPTDAPREEDQ